MPSFNDILDFDDFDEEAEIDRLIKAGYVECGWCGRAWHKKDRECPRCYAECHADEKTEPGILGGID